MVPIQNNRAALLFMHQHGHLIHNVLLSCGSRPTGVADCAVCAEGFAPGIAYSCRECSRGVTIWAVALMAAFVIASLLLTTVVLVHVGGGVPDESVEMGQSSRMRKCSSCRASIAQIIPFTAIKIVVTVWQIISQVCPPRFGREISTVALSSRRCLS